MKDIKYIIKRIIIGVGIALVLMYLKRGSAFLPVYAKEVSPYNTNGYYEDITSAYSSTTFTIPGAPYKSHGVGVLRFSLAITKTAGSSTDPILVPRLIQAYNGSSTAYVCNFGSTTNSNSTWTGQSYSVECPMNMDANGLTSILVAYVPFSQQSNSTFRVQFAPNISYEYGDSYDNGSSSVNSEAQAQGNATRNSINNATQNIINNQNNNTQQQIESQKVCSMIDKVNIKYTNKYLGSSAIEYDTSSSNQLGITDYISISSNDTLTALSGISFNSSSRYCFYNINKSFISCFPNNELSSGTNISIPINASYIRFTIGALSNEPSFRLCKNGNQAIADGQQQLNDTLNNDDVTGATGTAESFFDDFQADNHGLSGIITAPLRLIQSLSSSTCTPLSVPLPFVNTNTTIPCMSTIYSTYFGSFLTLYQLITTGLIGYWVCIKLFGHVKGMQDPKDDRIEVLQL